MSEIQENNTQETNAGDVEIDFTPEEAAAIEKEQLEAWGKRYAENALERERLRAEDLEHYRVIDKAREHAIENYPDSSQRFLDEQLRRSEEMQRPKLDAEERQERLAKIAEEWLQREQQLKERSQQPAEKTEPENLDEYVQSQYKWAKNYLKDNDLKTLLEHDSNYREQWLEGAPPDDPLAKEIRERFPPREEKQVDEPVNDPGAGDTFEDGFEHAPGEEGVDRTDEAIINSDKDVLEGYYRDVGDEEGADRTDEPVNDPVAGDTFEDEFGYDPGEGGADRNYESIYGTYESMYGTEDFGEDGADRANGPVVDTDEGYYRDVGDEGGADYMDDFGIDAVEGDPALSGFGEHAYESFGDAGETFDDSFDSDW